VSLIISAITAAAGRRGRTFGARDRLRQRTLHLAIKLARANESG